MSATLSDMAGLQPAASVLITGGLGYVGQALARHLSACGLQVDLCDVRTPPDMQEYEHNFGWPFTGLFFAVDYRRLITDLVRHYDTIIHVAGHSSVATAQADPAAAVANNVTGMVDLVRRMRPEQRLIYASSASVYSDSVQNIYDATKRAADTIIPVLHENSWGLQFGTVCGPSPAIRLDTMMNRMTWKAVTTGRIEMSNPAVRRPLLGIRDLCAAVERLVVVDDIPPGLHPLASENTTVGRVARGVRALTGAKIDEMPPSRGYDFEMQPARWMQPQDDLARMIAAILNEHGAGWRGDVAREAQAG
jgi:UDP-glucose 4-epimerase